jgi:hypothetical protein
MKAVRDKNVERLLMENHPDKQPAGNEDKMLHLNEQRNDAEDMCLDSGRVGSRLHRFGLALRVNTCDGDMIKSRLRDFVWYAVDTM